MSDHFYAVKLLEPERRVWDFIGSGGHVTRLRVHALMWDDLDGATAAARSLLEDNPDSVLATRVVQQDKVILTLGDPTIRRTGPQYGPGAGYRYLVGATKARYGIFHVTNSDGIWGTVTADVYEACWDEAKRAELDTRRLNIHGSICLLVTRGLVFVQHSNRA